MPINRREFATLATASAIISTTRTSAKPTDQPYHASEIPNTGPSERVLMLVYPGFTALDMVGPQYAFGSMVGAVVQLVAKSREPVRSDTGLIFSPDVTFSDAVPDPDILFTPGGLRGTLSAMQDPETIAFMRERGGQAKFVTSVCTGSLILGAAGLLKGYKATSHWLTLDLITRLGAAPVHERIVVDRNRITGAGVTAGIDFGLTIVGMLRGATYAQAVQLLAEYDPAPPFAGSGNPRTAPAAAREMIDRIMVKFRAEASSAVAAARP
ncbi:MAG: DJ-1/PfpI family protein [Rhodospirillales bacterium]|nr:DJ-1/PfpI family protein [Rhodospirillales bacterium]